MARFFAAGTGIGSGFVYLNEEDYAHLRVLRLKKGETFTVCDGEGTDYTCVLADAQGKTAVAKVLSSAPSSAEPTVRADVYAAWPKGDKAEFIVQKCVELGAYRIVFFPSEHCVARPDALKAAAKVQRLCRIAKEAAQQSGRGIVPVVSAADSFSSAVCDAAKAPAGLFLYEAERSLGLGSALRQTAGAERFSLMTGPEGGFSPEEAARAAAAGLKSTVMGPRILRCETAPLAALAALMLMTENMERPGTVSGEEDL